MNLLCCLKRAQAAVVQELLTSQHLTMEYYWNLCYLLFLTDNMSVFECLSWYSKHGQWATVEFVHFSKWIPKFYFVVFYFVALPYWKHTEPWILWTLHPSFPVLHHYDWWFTLFIHLNLCFSHVQRTYSELCHHFYTAELLSDTFLLWMTCITEWHSASSNFTAI